MVLLYVLFALTASMVLTALFTGQAAQHRQGHAFVFFFTLLIMAAGLVELWLVPVVASGQRSAFYPVVSLAIFCAILAASVILSVRSPRPARADTHRDTGLDAESAVFDSLIWLAVLIFGILVLKTAAV